MKAAFIISVGSVLTLNHEPCAGCMDWRLAKRELDMELSVVRSQSGRYLSSRSPYFVLIQQLTCQWS